MKTVLTAASLATLLITLSNPAAADSAAASTADRSARIAGAAQPVLGSFGIDLTARDESVRPGDDFFGYANGTWHREFAMPADKSRYGAFTILSDQSRQQVQTIVEELVAAGGEPGSNEQMIADFYRAFMDVEAVNSLGIGALRPQLEVIGAIDSPAALTAVLGRSSQLGVASPIIGYLGTDRRNPDSYRYTLATGGLGLPDRDYYLEETERFVKIRAAYLDNIEALLSFAGVADAAAQAERVLALETRIAEYLWPREKRRNRDLTLNPVARTALGEEYPGLDWDAYIKASGFSPAELNVTTPDALQAAIMLINSAEISDWRSYLIYHLVENHAGYLSEEIYARNFEFGGKVLNGQQEPEERWKRAINAMSGTRSLGFAIGQVYVARHFPESSKALMSELVANLRTALGQRIESLEWMGEETRANALEKLASFRPKIGYPDVWPALEGIEIRADDLMGNVLRLRAFFHADLVAKEHGPTDRERWGMTPQQVNAYYNSSFNEIVFPAAILQPPFFDPNADPAVNYGGIGAVIGHEMGHGFDDQGSKSDARGVQRNWWTDADREAFEARTAKLVAQYSAYEPIPGNFVNGENALGENIGDVGGLAMAYHAYRLSLGGKEAPVIDGLTGDQRFFLSWAQVWREKRTEESMLSQLRGGIHSPGRYRALAPRNHDAWYRAFDVKPDDALYLAPEERVRIW